MPTGGIYLIGSRLRIDIEAEPEESTRRCRREGTGAVRVHGRQEGLQCLSGSRPDPAHRRTLRSEWRWHLPASATPDPVPWRRGLPYFSSAISLETLRTPAVL